MYASHGSSKPHPAVTTLIFVVTLLPLYYGSWQYRSSFGKKSTTHHTPASSDDFLTQWLDQQVISPFDPWPLQEYCNHSNWRPDIVFNLDDANGGIGNVRGNTLDFLLYAIEAGASIMMPTRATRSQEDISVVWSSRAQFDTFFDEDWFFEAMEQACPQMAIYKPEAHHDMIPPLAARYQPAGRRVDMDKEMTREAYVQHFNSWLEEQADFDSDKLTVINVGRTLWEYDTRSLPAGVRRSLGQVLRTAPSIRRLAALVVRQMATGFAFDIDPSQAIPKQAFYGAHLRTEADAKAAGWLANNHANFSAQSEEYMSNAVLNKLNIMYVASGNASEIERFKDKATRHKPPLHITSKRDLLDETLLDSLTWDQQALIDYEVLQRSSIFGGFVRSSFSYNIALTRNQWLEDQGRVTDPWFVMHSEEGVAFDDGLSRIIGRDELHERRIPRGMWP